MYIYIHSLLLQIPSEKVFGPQKKTGPNTVSVSVFGAVGYIITLFGTLGIHMNPELTEFSCPWAADLRTFVQSDYGLSNVIE